jgi:hypothetical protein
MPLANFFIVLFLFDDAFRDDLEGAVPFGPDLRAL